MIEYSRSQVKIVETLLKTAKHCPGCFAFLGHLDARGQQAIRVISIHGSRCSSLQRLVLAQEQKDGEA